MALLSKEAILTADDLPFEDVEVPEWGGTIRLRAMTGAERDLFESAILTDEVEGQPRKVNLGNIRARLIALSAIGENGERLFHEADIEALGRKNAKPLDRLFDICQRLSGVSDRDVKALEKNSGAVRADSSPTSSPSS